MEVTARASGRGIDPAGDVLMKAFEVDCGHFALISKPPAPLAPAWCRDPRGVLQNCQPGFRLLSRKLCQAPDQSRTGHRAGGATAGAALRRRTSPAARRRGNALRRPN